MPHVIDKEFNNKLIGWLISRNKRVGSSLESRVAFIIECLLE